MNRFILAVRAFYAALVSREMADKIEAILDRAALPKLDTEQKRQQPAVTADSMIPSRSDAITLLAALQREARLVDLIKQPLGHFSDEQIGAAARNVLGDCAAALDRFFSLRPVIELEEDTPCDVPKGYDPAKYKLTGSVDGSGPFHGRLAHHGWQATTVKLPTWTGSRDAALVIAPAEVEIGA